MLNDREIYWINVYSSMIPNGYNMTFGGEGSVKINYDLVYSLWDDGNSIAQIAKIVNHSISQIRHILLDYNNFSVEANTQRTIDATKKKVGQYDKNTNELIKIHDSIKDAAAAVNADRSCISRCCSGKKKSSRGFVWRFI